MRFGSSKRAAFCIAFAIAGAARADGDDAKPPAFELAQDAVIVRDARGETVVNVGCAPRSFTSAGTKAYALCGQRTVVVVDAEPTPHVERRIPIDARIVSLTVIDGVISARTSTGVKPLDQYPVGSLDAPPPRAPTAWWAHMHGASRPKPPERVQGLELTLDGTADIGVDGQVGVASVFDAAVVWRPSVPILLAAYGVFGAATGAFDPGDRNLGPRGGDMQVAVGEAVVGVDTRYVGFAFGAGAGMFERGYQVEPLIVARGRFGPVDEFSFTWHTSFATGGQTILGVIGGAVEFRIARRAWMGADAELGNLDYGRFMVDARVRVRDGKSGTVDLRAGVGLAYVESSADCQTVTTKQGFAGDTECIGTNTDYLGPAVSVGVVFRP
ncbi:MAG TPA: hypothetical protein VGH28_11270 [Polyangiaceae bacterium]|jgi:hypothetical protein